MEKSPSRVTIRPAEESDLPLLAEMNFALLLDEQSRNPMSLPELAERMRGWLDSEWKMVLLEREGSVIGYGIYRLQKDSYFPDRDAVYVRQYFLRAEYRGQGLGRAGFEAMVQSCFPAGCRIELETLATNPKGMAFWQRMGFRVYCTTFVRENEQGNLPSVSK